MKGFHRWLGSLLLVTGIAGFAIAAGSNCVQRFTGTGSNRSTQIYCLDTSGNLTTAGTISSTSSGANTVSGSLSVTGAASSAGLTNTGKTIYTPTSVTSVSTSSTISPSATYLLLCSTGSTVILGAGSIAAVSTTTATNGQYLVLDSTTSTSTVWIATGTTAGVEGPSVYTVISSTKSPVELIYSATRGLWKQVNTQAY